MIDRTFLTIIFVFIFTMPVSLQSAQGKLPAVQDYRYYNMLLQTAREGDIKAAEVLLAAKADINSQLDIDKTTALMEAVANNQIEFVQFLLKHGAKVNVRDVDGKSALMHALDNDFLDLAKILLEAGADPELMDNKGKTVYDYATKLKNARQIIFLIKESRAKYERKQKHMQHSEKALVPIPETEIKIKSSAASEQPNMPDQSKSKVCVVM